MSRPGRNADGMRRLSSRSTWFHKRIFPLIWFGMLLIPVYIALCVPAAQHGPGPAFLLVPLVMGLVGWFVFRRVLGDLVDEVWDGGDHLLVKNRGQQEDIALDNVMNVSVSTMVNPPRITLRLRKPGRFGRDIAFTPPARFGLIATSHPLGDELIERVDAARLRVVRNS